MKKIIIILSIIFFSSFLYIKADAYQLIVVNKKINKLAFYEDGKLNKIYKVATGRTKKLTPEGEFKIRVKWKCPVYYKTNNGGCTYGNPLGPRWLGLSVPGTEGYTYGIHGNSNAASIGTNASSGCIRMYNNEITELFLKVEKGANVVIYSDNRDIKSVGNIYNEKIRKKITIEKQKEKERMAKEIQVKKQKIQIEKENEILISTLSIYQKKKYSKVIFLNKKNKELKVSKKKTVII